MLFGVKPISIGQGVWYFSDDGSNKYDCKMSKDKFTPTIYNGRNLKMSSEFWQTYKQAPEIQTSVVHVQVKE